MAGAAGASGGAPAPTAGGPEPAGAEASGGAGGAPADPEQASGGGQAASVPLAAPSSLFSELVGTDEQRNDVAGGAVCERVATIQCAAEASCCADAGRSFETCKSTMKQGCVETLLLDAITASPKAGYDRARAATTFAEYERLAGLCDLSVAAWGLSSDGLAGLARGTLAPGASCQASVVELAFPQTAAPFLFACTSPATHACFPTPDVWTCAPRAPEGGACFMDMNCAADLFCTNSEDRNLSGGVCSARKGEGAPCAYPSECLSLACKAGACVAATQQNLFCLDDRAR